MMGPSLSDPLVTPEHGLGDDLGVSDIAGGLARPKRLDTGLGKGNFGHALSPGCDYREKNRL